MFSKLLMPLILIGRSPELSDLECVLSSVEASRVNPGICSGGNLFRRVWLTSPDPGAMLPRCVSNRNAGAGGR